MQLCGVCRELKHTNQYHKTKSRPNGLQWACIDCEREINRRRRIRNPEASRIVQRKYYARTRQERRRKLREHAKKHPSEFAARYKMRWAIKTGKLVRQPCEICGNPKSEGHHDDYNKPYDVRWLCRKHHAEHHFKKSTASTSALQRLGMAEQFV